MSDSEATVFNRLSKQLKRQEIALAVKSVELVIVSTNGADDSCKSRINPFFAQEIEPIVDKNIVLTMKYKYDKPHKTTS